MPQYLIVSERVRKSLGPFPGVGFFEVVFDKLFRFPYSEGDLSFYETIPEFRGGRYRSADNFIRRVAACPPEECEHVGRYYELIMMCYWRIATHFVGCAQAREVSVRMTDRRRPVTFLISAEVLKQYSIIYHEDGAYLMNEEFYRALVPFLNPRYFDIHLVEY